jgi:hypothetical protein
MTATENQKSNFLATENTENTEDTEDTERKKRKLPRRIQRIGRTITEFVYKRIGRASK